MSNPIIIVCDDKGNPTGEFVDREVGHTGEGRHHLAITVLLYNSKNEVLLQKRKHKRFDSLMDLTGATDLYHFEDGKQSLPSGEGRNESFEEATIRCLKREYKIEQVNNLKNLGGFNYFMKDGQFCENEFCAMLVGEYNGEVKMDPNVGYEYRWVKKQDLLKDIEAHPQNYTPWAIDGVKVLKMKGFFSE